MDFIENNGKKVAAVLCVASCLPVVATVYAMETEPGWHGDKFVNEDATMATGWQEIEGESYYFTEDGSVDKDASKKAVVASVSSQVTADVKQDVEEKKAEAAAQSKADKKDVEVEKSTVEETVVSNVETKPNVESDKTVVETTPDTQENAPVVDVKPSAPQENAPVVDVKPSAPQETEPAPAPQETEPAPAPQENVPAPAPQENQPAIDAQTDLNNRIAAAAKDLVGVTDGLWCTQVVQQALANAGVQNAMQMWPDQYVGYGQYVDASMAQAGNLIYYNNGGRGQDHIAIYVGNGMAVHGNYNGQTVIAGAYLDGCGNPQFIQVGVNGQYYY